MKTINKIKKENKALERFFKFFQGKKGQFLFETYKNAGFPCGANGEGFFRWIREINQTNRTAETAQAEHL